MKNINLRLSALLVISTSLAVFTGCLDSGGGGGGDVAFTNPGDASGGGASTGISIAITKVQSLLPAAWITDSSGRMYTQNNVITIEGTCTRGVATIGATINSTDVSETAPCASDGSFTWSKTMTSGSVENGDEYAITLKALTPAGTAVTGVTASQTVMYDNNAPAAPTMDPVAGCGDMTTFYLCSSSSVTITGSYSGTEGVVSTQAPATGTKTDTTSTTFSFVVAMAEGDDTTFDFTVTDRAGNVSPSGSRRVKYAPTIDVMASGTFGSTSGFDGGPIGVAPAMFGTIAPMAIQVSDSNATGNVMLTGTVGVGASRETQ